ncbi:Gfo/Idh/MocA family protein [Pseudonocardia kunmingensis]|uniref:Putative dehydrogenase n=1 Tax=Pseudonocardia kunmingensis TaxID=630975 RepID=A0A543D474_9PSEU|nr:Gfo/Idh/MocA family oxidoreductase [Pseudonocardia kunmingensis]TQM04119.1 putative dehydrogenase [Pseudonocardia kunmingensis]
MSGHSNGSGPVRVGVIGAGVISTEYLRNLTGLPDLDVRAVGDLDPARARAQADAFGVRRSGAVDAVLADDEIELVVNLTVPQAHVDVALQAIGAGKHVWNEKPIGLDRAGTAALLDAARTSGLRVATAPDTFLGTGIQTARRLVESGAIGTPLTALTLMQGPGPESWHPNPDFLFQDGAGPLFDIGPYYLTALVQLLGPVARVQAETSQARAVRVVGSGPRAGQRFDVTVPTHVAGLYAFAGGAGGQCLFSFDSAIKRRQFEISGTDGTISVPDPNTFAGEVVVHRMDGEQVTVPSVPAATTRGRGVLELARAVREGRPERASGELGAHVLDVMISTVEAAERGGAVDVASTVEVGPALPEDWDPAERTLHA